MPATATSAGFKQICSLGVNLPLGHLLRGQLLLKLLGLQKKHVKTSTPLAALGKEHVSTYAVCGTQVMLAAVPRLYLRSMIKFTNITSASITRSLGSNGSV